MMMMVLYMSHDDAMVVATSCNGAARLAIERLNLRPGLLAFIVRPYSQMSEEYLSRPPPGRAARAPHAVHPAAPARGIDSSSQGTLHQNEVKVSIPSKDLLEGIETLTEFWYHNNIWPRKMMMKMMAGTAAVADAEH